MIDVESVGHEQTYLQSKDRYILHITTKVSLNVLAYNLCGKQANFFFLTSSLLQRDSTRDDTQSAILQARNPQPRHRTSGNEKRRRVGDGAKQWADLEDDEAHEERPLCREVRVEFSHQRLQDWAILESMDLVTGAGVGKRKGDLPGKLVGACIPSHVGQAVEFTCDFGDGLVLYISTSCFFFLLLEGFYSNNWPRPARWFEEVTYGADNRGIQKQQEEYQARAGEQGKELEACDVFVHDIAFFRLWVLVPFLCRVGCCGESWRCINFCFWWWYVRFGEFARHYGWWWLCYRHLGFLYVY